MTYGLKLTPALHGELQWLAGEGPPNVARHARIVLGRASGMSIPAVAESVGVHPNTIRNCLRRFEAHGLRGLAHASAGKPKNVAFTESVRDEVARVAMHSPSNVGEPYAQWSLRRLRTYLIRRGVVQTISVEGLRQQLRGLPLPAVYWRRVARPLKPLSGEVRHALESLAEGPRADRALRAQIVLASSRGLNEQEIAAALHIGRGTVRRWLRRFRRAGILGLQTLSQRSTLTSAVRQAILRIAKGDPRRYGSHRNQWTMHSLQTALLRYRIVRTIGLEQLRRILAEGGVDLEGVEAQRYPQQSPAVG
jgi:transposase